MAESHTKPQSHEAERKSMMSPDELSQRFERLTSAHLADACLRAAVPVRCAPAGLQAVLPGSHIAGSVDVFLEAMEHAAPGDILVVDNAGRLDESCVGDLIAQEAQTAGLAGLVIWGLHRDTAELRAIGLPVFSLGTIPTGPLRQDPRDAQALESATVGEWTVTREDLALGDDDGVLFLPAAQAEALLTRAETIRDTERRQAERIRQGVSLRAQVRFHDYLAQRQQTPSLTFRQHLREVGGAIEE
jgi:regulator of RNase E activity RraA